MVPVGAVPSRGVEEPEFDESRYEEDEESIKWIGLARALISSLSSSSKYREKQQRNGKDRLYWPSKLTERSTHASDVCRSATSLTRCFVSFVKMTVSIDEKKNFTLKKSEDAFTAAKVTYSVI
ncbi:hypothetical protein L1987_12691 [Smallanthus sonchifolius]|uniref:Uncharacterized protein n=1 Tax=Smallanthus sonchifolius TaxID=185202 RepID=A0ACB9JH34_9ASTR|nr:hypothetical protein L1987_12691 [Smallanthus sonchifolius]